MIGDWMMTNDDRFAASSTAAAFKKTADSSAAKLRRSHSDSNLANANATLDDIRAKVRRGMAVGENRSSVTTANFTLGAAHKEDECTDELVASVANKLVKSEMRDRNIREPEHIDHSMFRAESFHHAADSSAIANESWNSYFDCFCFVFYLIHLTCCLERIRDLTRNLGQNNFKRKVY